MASPPCLKVACNPAGQAAAKARSFLKYRWEVNIDDAETFEERASRVAALLRQAPVGEYEAVVAWQDRGQAEVQELMVSAIEPALNERIASLPQQEVAESRVVGGRRKTDVSVGHDKSSTAGLGGDNALELMRDDSK